MRGQYALITKTSISDCYSLNIISGELPFMISWNDYTYNYCICRLIGNLTQTRLRIGRAALPSKWPIEGPKYISAENQL